MANVTITQLPAAGPITGTESVPIVQNGQTVQTTTAAIASAPNQTQTFLTLNNEPTLPNSRYLSTGSGLGLVDGGAGSYYRITLNAASGSLETASNGIITKTSANTVVARSLATSGDGLTVTNGNAVAGNPTFALTGIMAAIASMSPAGLIAVRTSNTVSPVSVVGTANQIDVANGNGLAGNPTLSLATNPVLPGTGSTTFPIGDTAARPSIPVNGMFRYNTDTARFEGYANNAWGAITTGSGVSSVATGYGLTGGPITSTGTIAINNAIVATLSDAQTLTNKTISGASNTLTNIPNAALSNSQITIGSTAVSLGGTITSLAGVTISGSANTLNNIDNASLVNSSLTIGSTSVSLGGTASSLGGLSSVTVTADPTLALQLTTKQYVDGLVSTGLTYHQPVQAATTASLATLTGGSVTYNNGSSGVGATITLGVALTTLDGYSLVNTNRILVKDETNQAYNGIYTWATGGTVLTRATDADTYGPNANQFSQNDYFFVQNGTVNKGSSYVVTTAGTIVFGTTAITFAQFSTSQVYTGTTPIQVSGTAISLTTVPVNLGGTNITSYATGDLLYASGATTLAKLTLGTTNYVLTAGASAPQYVAQSTLSVGSATNATNVAITQDTTTATAVYPTWVTANTGNLPVKTTSTKLSFVPSTGVLTATGGISGGTF